MTLPGSGPISIDQIRNEFQRGTPISMNQLYGATTGIPTSGPISFSDFYGKSYIIDDFVMTVGVRGLGNGQTRYGYLKSSEGNDKPTGSISPTEINAIYPSTSHIVINLFWDNYTGNHLGPLTFSVRRVSGDSITNSGWSALLFNNRTFTRSGAIYSTNGPRYYWSWDYLNNPFEGLIAGSIITVSFLG